MKKSAQNSVKELLTDTILALCRNTLAYQSKKVCVEGLIGVTIDDDEIILVSINDQIKGELEDKKRDNGSDESSESESDTGGGSAKKKKRRRRKRSGSKDDADGQPTPKKSLDQGMKIKGEDNEDVMVIIKEETPEDNPDLEWMQNMDSSSFQQPPPTQTANMYPNFPNLQSTMGATAFPGPSSMASPPGAPPGQGAGGMWGVADQSFCAKLSCALCGKIYVSQDVLDDHVSKCMAKRFVCQTCGMRFRSNQHLQRHMNTHNK